ncbi:MAG: hypothetical protein JXB62_14360 [Pirellulales bacterium]|nr:hypothetical protein [Pirellulales bacterium]
MPRLLRLACLVWMGSTAMAAEPIDRRDLVQRHRPVLGALDPLAPLSVGNGEFAFTADVTGLQTFPASYARGIPLGTQAHWGWHSFPNPKRYRLEDALVAYDTHGRTVVYASETRSEAGRWLRANPHRLGLGRIGFELLREDGTKAEVDDLRAVEQTLDLWTGALLSRFEMEGETVRVSTRCHPRLDLLAVRVESPLIRLKRLRVAFRFAYGAGRFGKEPEDWSRPDAHETTLVRQTTRRVDLVHTLDDCCYRVGVAYRPAGRFVPADRHGYELVPVDAGECLEFVVAFSPQPLAEDLPDVSATRSACEAHWARFWSTGGAIDLAGSTDPRAAELERRIVLSQYLTAIQCAGSLPPQETGLTLNSWYGKFHLEMHWWHAAHFALWDRTALLEKSLPWYASILPIARQTARRQGYRGARWPKMVGPDGREGPSGVGVFLIWQQPHPIYYAELCYRNRPSRATLTAYRDVVFETAEFMASYARWDEQTRRYVLGPPLIPAQECYNPETTTNPTFELEYWRWGLQTAQLWRERLGQPRCGPWDDVIRRLSPLPGADGVYQTAEGIWANTDHPSHLAACGVLPGGRVDRPTMRRTLDRVRRDWQWDRTWGWDYPMAAMTAARVGEAEAAVDLLMMPVAKNRYLKNGHNWQSDRLPVYLPGNGGLLAAVAMMAAGWDGAPDRHAPGFPANGRWTVRWERLQRMP